MAHRSQQVIAYPNTWNGISGFIDELKPLEELVRQELHEEVGIEVSSIDRIEVAPRQAQTDQAISRVWEVFPVLVELRELVVPRTNWEHKSARWVPLTDVSSLPLMPFYAETLEIALRLRAM